MQTTSLFSVHYWVRVNLLVKLLVKVILSKKVFLFWKFYCDSATEGGASVFALEKWNILLNSVQHKMFKFSLRKPPLLSFSSFLLRFAFFVYQLIISRSGHRLQQKQAAEDKKSQLLRSISKLDFCGSLLWRRKKERVSGELITFSPVAFCVFVVVALPLCCSYYCHYFADLDRLH